VLPHCMYSAPTANCFSQLVASTVTATTTSGGGGGSFAPRRDTTAIAPQHTPHTILLQHYPFNSLPFAHRTPSLTPSLFVNLRAQTPSPVDDDDAATTTTAPLVTLSLSLS
jgi:hypothetical protein